MKLTEKQISALVDLRDGEWHYGISIRYRRALPSLKKRGLVFQDYGRTWGHLAADQWKITDTGRIVMSKCATLRHLPR